ncbi:MAG TPA: M23 family metallopeptidase [Gemmatimonadaceae bacterium]
MLSVTSIPRSRRLQTVAVLAMLPLAACEGVRRVAEDLLDTRTPRQRYVDGLAAAGLATSALARDWSAAGHRALLDAPVVDLPHIEEGYLPPGEPAAIGLRARVRRGQEVTFLVEFPGDSSGTIYLDAWLVEGDSTPPPLIHVESADSGTRSIRVRPRRDAEVVMRAQPELLRGGRFRATMRVAPTLAFPVGSGTERDVGSRFGASRDGGRRNHHGIDIFAQRGTPVVAAAAGVVRRVEETAIGGKVVWLRDREGNSLYYAHLDRQAVTNGMQIDAGDTLGYVGNTGNARTTPPHLHFGVYQRGSGPVDPWWFVHRPRGSVASLEADTTRLGGWIRLPRDGTLLRAGPSMQSDTVAVFPRLTAMRVLSATGGWYRVRLPDGATGFVSARLTESADRALRVATVDNASPMLARPTTVRGGLNVVALVTPADSLDVLGRFGDFILVRSARGMAGWVAEN